MIKKEVQARLLNLKREEQTSKIEADCLTMPVDSTKEFRIIDTKVHQRIRTRLNNQKSKTGMSFETTMSDEKANTIVITRKT